MFVSDHASQANSSYMTNDSRRESCGPKNLPDGADVVAHLLPAAEVGPVPDLIDNYRS